MDRLKGELAEIVQDKITEMKGEWLSNSPDAEMHITKPELLVTNITIRTPRGLRHFSVKLTEHPSWALVN